MQQLQEENEKLQQEIERLRIQFQIEAQLNKQKEDYLVSELARLLQEQKGGTHE